MNSISNDKFHSSSSAVNNHEMALCIYVVMYCTYSIYPRRGTVGKYMAPDLQFSAG